MTTGTQRRQAIIDQVASCVCKDRQNTYGDAEDNFANIAEYWTVWLRSRKLIAADAAGIQAHDVAVMSGLIKVARLSTSPDHIDNWVDLAGYSVCGGGIRVNAKERKPCEEEIAVGSRWEHVQTRELVYVANVELGAVVYTNSAEEICRMMRDEFLGWHVPKKRSNANGIKIGSEWASVNSVHRARVVRVDGSLVFYEHTAGGTLLELSVDAFLRAYRREEDRLPVGPAKFPENAGETVTPAPTPDKFLPEIKIGSQWRHKLIPSSTPVVVIGATALVVAAMVGNTGFSSPIEEFLHYYEPCTT